MTQLLLLFLEEQILLLEFGFGGVFILCQEFWLRRNNIAMQVKLQFTGSARLPHAFFRQTSTGHLPRYCSWHGPLLESTGHM